MPIDYPDYDAIPDSQPGDLWIEVRPGVETNVIQNGEHLGDFKNLGQAKKFVKAWLATKTEAEVPHVWMDRTIEIWQLDRTTLKKIPGPAGGSPDVPPENEEIV